VKVSVIVTTYNKPDYLRRVLDCLAHQVRLPDEVMVADDGSGPETGDHVRSISSASPYRLAHVWHEDEGFRAARIRNQAVKESTGDYVIFLDGDCLVNRHFISDHMRLLEKGFFVQGKRVLIGRDISASISRREVNSAPAMLRLALGGGISNLHHLIRMPVFPAFRKLSHRGIKTCNMGVHREDVYAVNGFNERFVGWGREDSEFAARLFSLGVERKDHPFMAVCYHLWHEENLRDNLVQNDSMLEDTIASGITRCADGIEKRSVEG
jgi:glycosyltransferase involved in cell wall biosynthesis